jgi:hypothetical protein
MDFLFSLISAFFYFHILIFIVLAIGVEMTFMGNDSRGRNPDLNGVEKLIWIYLGSIIAFFIFDAVFVFFAAALLSFVFAKKAVFISLTFYKDAYNFFLNSNKK